MRAFQARGALWTDVDRRVEPPFFVASELARMARIADLCACAPRRHVERPERDLFDMRLGRADRRRDTVAGVRHFAGPNCRCAIRDYRRTWRPPPRRMRE